MAFLCTSVENRLIPFGLNLSNERKDHIFVRNDNGTIYLIEELFKNLIY